MNLPLVTLLQSMFSCRPRPDFQGVQSDAIPWLIETGFAPVLWAAVQANTGLVSAMDRQSIKAANLAARLLSDAMFECLEQILAAAQQQHIPVILLKGVGVAQQWYPARHWRPMRDIDILVHPGDQARLETSLRNLGYRQQGTLPAEFFIGHQHSMPFYRDDPPCWIEVHTALFRAGSTGAEIPVFKPETVFEQSVALPGSSARCVSPEVQLIYTAVHWGSKLTQVGGLIPVMDVLLLLDKAELDWGKVAALCKHTTAARHLYLLLSWLQCRQLAKVPDAMWRALEPGRRSLSDTGTRILHRIIDRHLVEGQPYRGFQSEALVNVQWESLLGDEQPALKLVKLPWRLLFPPQAQNRYELGRQLRRLRALWRKD